MNIQKVPVEESYGTSYKGDFHTSYRDLVKGLGEPNATSGDVEWVFKDVDKKIVFTIYDSERNGGYVKVWHIGGFNDAKKVVPIVIEYLMSRGVRVKAHSIWPS